MICWAPTAAATHSGAIVQTNDARSPPGPGDVEPAGSELHVRLSPSLRSSADLYYTAGRVPVVVPWRTPSQRGI
jgi:hypothetical protein